MEKVLSVSVAAYNVEKYIRETLDCFVGVPGIERLEVIVVDDGGKDSTPAIVQEYVEKYPDVFRLVRKENGGWGSTINASLKVAEGKYFKLLDGDDYFVHDHIKGFLDGLENMDADLVITPAYAFDSDTKRRIFSLMDYPFPTNYRAYDIERLNMWAFHPSVYGVCYKTELLRSSGMQITPHCFYTDVEFVLKGFNTIKTAGSLPMEIYCYRKARSGQSMSLEGVRKHYQDHLKMVTTMLAFERDHVSNGKIHEIFYARLTDAITNMYRWFMYLEPSEEHKKEMMDFDHLLKTEYPSYYWANAFGDVGILRRTNFKLYKQIAARRLKLDQKNHYDLFA